PALIKEVAPAQNFEVEMHLQGRTNYRGETFRIEFYLFDEAMNVLGKMCIWDLSSIHEIVAEGRVGPFIGRHQNYLISSRNYKHRWYEFTGIIRMKREGNVFSFYVARLNNEGKHTNSFSQTFVDSSNAYAGRLKYVQIH